MHFRKKPHPTKVFVVSEFPHTASSDPCDANQVSANSSSCPCAHHLTEKPGTAGEGVGGVGKYEYGGWTSWIYE